MIHSGRRIIPARAGFTAPCALDAARTTDHPRSRGVYAGRSARASSGCGSSPLARGLRRQTFLRSLDGRIIPARAGFTPASSRRRPRPRDHPRSRGVYQLTGAMTQVAVGSSPLARGLPQRVSTLAHEIGIIPARAGFTLVRGYRRSEGQDHPRSRGVYPEERASWSATLGSSPLARGLPRGEGVVVGDPGIIPARAGFTPSLDPGARVAADHPRSRGVYGCGTWVAQYAGGSSPLARGLPGAEGSPRDSLRIIPARAGFTRCGRPPPERRADHPRSRGVYASSRRIVAAPGGSSPLARGLHHMLLPFVRGDLDHPRSRGVYLEEAGLPIAPDGSSPLARGLRTTCSTRSSSSPDHPRSRGVYH